jgi:hypothetical protein
LLRQRGFPQSGSTGGLRRVLVEKRSHRPCTLVYPFSKTALEEPFLAAEGFYMGVDRETRESPRYGKE